MTTVLDRLRTLLKETPSLAESLSLPLLAQANIRQDEQLFQQLIVLIREQQLPRPAVVETLLQCCLFDGYPSALEGLRRLSELWPEEVTTPLEQYTAEQLQDWRSRGELLCGQIYGDSAASLIRNVTALSPDLGNWFLVEGYGRVLSRAGLSIQVRELVTVAILLWKDYPRQLLSHIRGALRVGVDCEVVRELIQLCERGDDQLQQQALTWCERYRGEYQRVGSDGRTDG